MNLYDIFLFPRFRRVTRREGLSRAGEGGFLGHREVVDGKAGHFVWQSSSSSPLVTPRYVECNEIMKAYARALKKHDLLSVTDGTSHRSDGEPVAARAGCEA